MIALTVLFHQIMLLQQKVFSYKWYSDFWDFIECWSSPFQVSLCLLHFCFWINFRSFVNTSTIINSPLFSTPSVPWSWKYHFLLTWCVLIFHVVSFSPENAWLKCFTWIVNESLIISLEWVENFLRHRKLKRTLLSNAYQRQMNITLLLILLMIQKDPIQVWHRAMFMAMQPFYSIYIKIKWELL